MKAITEEITVTKSGTVYVTDDGKRFDNKYEATLHERNIYVKSLKESPDVIIKDNGLYPFEEFTNPDNKDYIWYKPLTQKGVDLLNKAYDVIYGDVPEVGKWICYEVPDYDDEVYSYSLDETIARFSELLNSLGVVVNIEYKEGE